jgi:alkanesulfonate monooxygenase SsuD/methylene tetrahydromethanopterin reductase-like flavin-dependent oxidoreductase (luciferase family)
MQAVGQKARAAAAGAMHTTIESVMERGMFICGSPDSVAQQLEHHQKQVGYGKLVAMMQFGTLPHELTKRNMELFASKVMPKIRHLGEDDTPIKVEAAE